MRGNVTIGAPPGISTAQWRHVQVPHDFSLDDLPPLIPVAEHPLERGAWKFKLGDNLDWKAPDFDDAPGKR